MRLGNFARILGAISASATMTAVTRLRSESCSPIASVLSAKAMAIR